MSEWTEVTPAYDGVDGPPPTLTTPADPRTDDCRHDWAGEWGQKGERQRRCSHCARWIWDRWWWEVPT